MPSNDCLRSQQDRRRSSMKRLQNSEIVTLRVGQEGQPFRVHEELICYWSKYFRNAFKGPFKEVEDKTITLDDVSRKTFSIVMNWLYSQELYRRPAECSNGSNRHRDMDLDRTSVGAARQEPIRCFKAIKHSDAWDAMKNLVNNVREQMDLTDFSDPTNVEIFLSVESASLFRLLIQPFEKQPSNLPYTVIHNSGIMLLLREATERPASSIQVIRSDLGSGNTDIKSYGKEQCAQMFSRWKTMVESYSDVDTDENWSYSTLVDLYIFADEYDVPILRIDCFNLIFQKNKEDINHLPDFNAVCKAWAKLPTTSGLYRYFEAIYVYQWDTNGYSTKQFRDLHLALPERLKWRMAMTASSTCHGPQQSRDRKFLFEYDPCAYHDHSKRKRDSLEAEETEPRPRKKLRS